MRAHRALPAPSPNNDFKDLIFKVPAQRGRPSSIPEWAHKAHLHSQVGLPNSIFATPKGNALMTENSFAPQSQVLDEASNIVVIGWDSFGLGHTGRGFAPLYEAIKKPVLKSGDTVVFHIPTPWGDAAKRKSATAALNDIRNKLEENGINVLFFRSDKTVLTDYKKGSDKQPGGQSDNAAGMQSIALQSRRPIPKAIEINWDRQHRKTRELRKRGLTDNDLKAVPVVTATNLIGSLKRSIATGLALAPQPPLGAPAPRGPNIIVLDDMDPSLAKAAATLGVTRRVSQSNHANLFNLANPQDTDDVRISKLYDDRSKFIWSKMQYGGPGHIQAEISPYRNTLSGFVASAENIQTDYKITKDTLAKDARQKVIDKFMEDGKKIDLTQPYAGAPGIFVAEGSMPTNLVSLYVQDMTPAYGEYIRKKMQNGDKDFCDTMFVVCNRDSFKPDCPTNALQYGMFGTAGTVMAGGFGTTSEAWYAANRGHQGVVTVRPAANQREQEANADQLVAAHPNYVTRSTEENWKTQFDDLVRRSHAQPLEETMEYLFDAIANEDSNQRHTMELMFGMVEPSIRQQKMNDTLTALHRDLVSKAMRRTTAKVLVPLLSTLIVSGSIKECFRFRMTAKSKEQNINGLRSVIDALRNKELLSKLIGVPTEHIDLEALGVEHAIRRLEPMLKLSRAQVRVEAQRFLDHLSDTVKAGL